MLETSNSKWISNLKHTVCISLTLALGLTGCGLTERLPAGSDSTTSTSETTPPTQSSDLVRKQVQAKAAPDQAAPKDVVPNTDTKTKAGASKNFAVRYRWLSDVEKRPRLSVNINGVNQTLPHSLKPTTARQTTKYSSGKRTLTFPTVKELDYTFTIHTDNQEVCNIPLEGPDRSSCVWGKDEASRADYFWSTELGKKPILTMNISADTDIKVQVTILSTPYRNDGSIYFIQKQNKLTFTSDTPGTFIVEQASQELCNLRSDNNQTLTCEFEVIGNPGGVLEDYTVSLSGAYLTVSFEKAISLLDAHFRHPKYLAFWCCGYSSQLSDGEKDYKTKPLKVARISSVPSKWKWSAKRDVDSDSELLVLFYDDGYDLAPIGDEADVYGLVMLRADGTDYIISKLNRKQVRKVTRFR